jgi:hypothetical protein
MVAAMSSPSDVETVADASRRIRLLSDSLSVTSSMLLLKEIFVRPQLMINTLFQSFSSNKSTASLAVFTLVLSELDLLRLERSE